MVILADQAAFYFHPLGFGTTGFDFRSPADGEGAALAQSFSLDTRIIIAVLIVAAVLAVLVWTWVAMVGINPSVTVAAKP